MYIYMYMCIYIILYIYISYSLIQLVGFYDVKQCRDKSFSAVQAALSTSEWEMAWNFQWIGSRENLQETIDFTIKYRAFL